MLLTIDTLVTCSPEIGNNRPMIAGTGTPVRRIVVFYKHGADAEEIVRRLSHLNLALVKPNLTIDVAEKYWCILTSPKASYY